MGRMYTCSIDAGDAESATASQIDFFEFTPADDKPIVLHAVFIGQLTEEGDTAAEMLGIEIRRGGTGMTSGSGGNAAANGVGTDPSYATSGFTFESMNTSLATFTSGVFVHSDAFNVQVGWAYLPTPEMRPQANQANGGMVVRLQGAPADSITWAGVAYVEELG